MLRFITGANARSALRAIRTLATYERKKPHCNIGTIGCVWRRSV